MANPHQKAPEGATAPHYDYPEHEKLKALGGANQIVGDFIGWLGEQDIELCERAGGRGSRRDEFVPCGRSRDDLLAAFFDIDRDKLEAEKQAMLAKLRAA